MSVDAMRRRAARSMLVALAATLATAKAAEQSAPAAPELRLSAPRVIAAGEPADIDVVIRNPGRSAMLVLPNMVMLRIEGAGAQYTPYPGPPIDPWGDAVELAAGGTTTVRFRGGSDRRGVWRLPPGTYRVRALYDVPPDLAAPATVSSPEHLWRGRVQSPPVSMRVTGPPS